MADQAHILVVDDDQAIRFFLSEELSLAGYHVSAAASGEEALARLQEGTVDLVLLDLKMGGMSGLQVLERIERLPFPPVVIILTAYASLDSAISAMRRRATDYLVKPCAPAELLSSVARGLAQREEERRRHTLVELIEQSAQELRSPRRKGPAQQQPTEQPRFLQARGLLVDCERLAVARQGKPVSLTPTEFRLLAHLMEHADRPLSFSELAQAVYGRPEDEFSARQSLSTHLWRLRKKLGQDPVGNDYIVNVRGRGYLFLSNAPR